MSQAKSSWIVGLVERDFDASASPMPVKFAPLRLYRTDQMARGR